MTDTIEMVMVPASLIPNVKTLLGNVNSLGDKFEGLGKQVAGTATAAQDAKTEIADALQQLEARTGPVLGLDVTDVIERISAASDRIARESATADQISIDLSGFGSDVSNFAAEVHRQAQINQPAPIVGLPKQSAPGGDASGLAGDQAGGAVSDAGEQVIGKDQSGDVAQHDPANMGAQGDLAQLIDSAKPEIAPVLETATAEDGTITDLHDDGATTVTTPEGTATHTAADGTVMVTEADGGVTITHTDGGVVTIPPSQE